MGQRATIAKGKAGPAWQVYVALNSMNAVDPRIGNGNGHARHVRSVHALFCNPILSGQTMAGDYAVIH